MLDQSTQPEGIVSQVSEGDNAFRATADDLRRFIERVERLEAEKRDIADQIKEVYSEAKGRGYLTTAMRKLVAERRKDPDKLAEENALLDMYRDVLS